MREDVREDGVEEEVTEDWERWRARPGCGVPG